MTAASLPLIVSSTRSVRLRRRATSSSAEDRKSTRLNSSHSQISYAVFCLKKKKHLAQLPPVAPSGNAPIDHSGRKQKGHASYYATKFAHRTMANGHRLDPQMHIAATKTSP